MSVGSCVGNLDHFIRADEPASSKLMFSRPFVSSHDISDLYINI